VDVIAALYILVIAAVYLALRSTQHLAMSAALDLALRLVVRVGLELGLPQIWGVASECGGFRSPALRKVGV
jgi:hypothetical protein